MNHLSKIWAVSVRMLTALALVALFLPAFVPSIAFGQGAVGGVYVDPEGVLRSAGQLSQTDRLRFVREQAAAPSDSQIEKTSTLRKVSLARLEKRLQELHEADDKIPNEIRYLAGLTRVQYVFFYPDIQDVVLAGPAEGWQVAESGETVGTESKRPVLHLDDFIAALRYAAATRSRDPFIGCSIDPTREGVQNYAKYMNSLAGRFDRSNLSRILKGMGTAMGSHNVRVLGVAPSSRFALVMLAADYRLKRIALAHDPSPVRGVTNYLDLTAKRASSPAGLARQHRWWFVADFDAIEHTEERLAYELRGEAMRVSTAPLSGKDDKPSKTATLFCDSFTKQMSEIAEKVPIFAELQNAIALSVVAEIVVREGREVSRTKSPATQLSEKNGELPRKNWTPKHFLDSEACSTGTYAAPREVPSLVNYRLVRGKYWMFAVSGGVEINTKELLEAKMQPAKGNRALSGHYQEMALPEVNTQWWWD